MMERPKLPGKDEPQQAIPAWYESVAASYPALASYLAPADPVKPGGKPQPGMTLMISEYQGSLQFSVGVRGAKELWAAPVDAPEAMLEAIEVRLRSGQLKHVDLSGGRS